MTFVSYAQNFEDVMLWRALRHVEQGFYVDVGAQDPDVDSVTRAFYERGWRGINIEPVKKYHLALAGKRPRDVNLNVAAGCEEGEIVFNVFEGTGLSTAVGAVASGHEEAGRERKQERVPVRTLQSICEQYHVAPIHFMKIDVEGFEADVLLGINLSRIRPWIVVVEATLPNSQVTSYESWEPMLVGAGYEFVYFDGLNRYYVAGEHRELAASFSSPPNVFDDFTFSGLASQPFCRLLLDRMQQDERERADLQARISADAAALAASSEHAAAAEAKLAEIGQSLQDMRAQVDAMADRERILDEVTARFTAAVEQRLGAMTEKVGHWQKAAHDAEHEAARLRLELQAWIDDARGWHAESQQSAERLAHVESRLAATLDSNHAWFVRATEMERQVRQLESSSSWRMTAPLRALRRLATRSLKAVLRQPLLLSMRWLRRHPSLWRFVQAKMRAYPRVFDRLRAMALSAGVVRAPADVQVAAATLQGPATAEEATMSRRQRDIFSRIRKGG